MSTTIAALTEAAARLTPAQKLHLANQLLAEVESADQTAIDAAWDAVIRERRTRYEKGHAETHSMEEVFAEMDRQLKKKLR